MPRAASASTRPSVSGSSGPTTTRSARSAHGQLDEARHVVGAHGDVAADGSGPGVARRDERPRARRPRWPRASACSRAPEPTTNTRLPMVISCRGHRLTRSPVARATDVPSAEARPAYPPRVADAPVPPPLPVAIRITRPYTTRGRVPRAGARDADAHERHAARRAGAASGRGASLRARAVVGARPRAGRGARRRLQGRTRFEGLGGLTLRFTRLDTRSKALVDKAAALREKRRPSTRPQFPDAVELPADKPPSPEPRREPAPPAAPAERAAEASPPAMAGPEPTKPAASPASAPEVVRPRASASAPPERDTLLDRLRARARALHPDDIERILAERRRA